MKQGFFYLLRIFIEFFIKPLDKYNDIVYNAIKYSIIERDFMEITVNQINEAIYDGFSKKYKAFGDFIDSGELWDICLSAISDVTLINNIIFCNDIHQIPPTNTFLKVKQIKRDLSELEKRSVGAFWGFVFKFVFGYRNQKIVAARVNTVKTATYFFDIAESVKVIDDNEGK